MSKRLYCLRAAVIIATVALPHQSRAQVQGADCPLYKLPGSLDHTFGEDTNWDGKPDGFVRTPLGPDEFGNNTIDEAYAVMVQPDGKILIAGRTQGYDATWRPVYHVALVRYNTDGTLDTTFGVEGIVKALPGGQASGYFGASDAVLQPDGKIVICGLFNDGTGGTNGNDFMVARFNADGTLDTSFGTGGIATAHSGGSDHAWAVTLDAQGRVIVCGLGGSSDFGVARFTAEGTPDSTFGTGGTVSTDFGEGANYAHDVVVQPDGRIVVVGEGTVPYRFAVVRYNADGSRDHTFGGDMHTGASANHTPDGIPDGFIIIDTCIGAANACALLEHDGQTKILVAGGVFTVARLLPDGSLDPSFGGRDIDGDGTPDPPGIVNPITEGTEAEDMVLFGEGLSVDRTGVGDLVGPEIVLGGYFGDLSTKDFAVLRFSDRGVPDFGFGMAGTTRTDLAQERDHINAMAIGADGKIIAVGRSRDNVDYMTTFSIARYNGFSAPGPDTDGDGVMDVTEDGVDGDGDNTPDGDGNQDGTPDREQNRVLSLPNSMDCAFVTLVLPEEGEAVFIDAFVRPAPISSQGNPEFLTTATGLIGFTVLGNAADVTMLLHQQVDSRAYFGHGALPRQPVSRWYAFSRDLLTGLGGNVFDDDFDGQIDRAVIGLRDGERGDSDREVDGLISHTGVLGTRWYPTVGKITGRVFHDRNQDGIQDPDEPGLEGWLVYVDFVYDYWFDSTADPSVRTDAKGRFEFGGFQPEVWGSYRVVQILPPGWSDTLNPTEMEVPLNETNPAVTNLLFANVLEGDATRAVEGIKWLDVNRDGTRALDGSEPGLADYTIYLDIDEDGGFTPGVDLPTQTAADGRYRFQGLPEATYIIRELAVPGDVPTFPSGGAHSRTIVSGQPTPDADFGNAPPALIPGPALQGTKFHDTNGNGLREDDEPGLADWRIFLDEIPNGVWDDPAEPSVLTDAEGRYQFSGIDARPYVVGEVPQNNWLQMAPGQHELTQQLTHPGMTAPRRVRAGDFLGDASIDLVVADADSLTFFVGRGDGSFGPVADLPLGHLVTELTGLTVGDWDSNGHTDLAVCGPGHALLNEVVVLYNNGDNTFRTFPIQGDDTWVLTDMSSGDVNGNGHLDLLVAIAGANQSGVYQNSTQGEFEAWGLLTYQTGAYPATVLAADLDGDDHLDIATANRDDDTVSVVMSRNNAFWFETLPAVEVGDPTVTDQPIALAALDVNGDAVRDLAVANSGTNTVSILLNDGTGTLTFARSLPIPGGPRDLVPVDFDADGDEDLVIAGDEGLTILIVEAGALATVLNLPVGPVPVSVIADDLDGANGPDLAVARQTADAVSVLMQRPDTHAVDLSGLVPMQGIDFGNRFADWNDDGIDDSLQPHVATVQSEGCEPVTIVAPEGTVLTRVAIVPNPSPADAPADVVFPLCFVDLEVTGLPEGTEVTVDLLFHGTAQVECCYGYGPTPTPADPAGWHEFVFDGTAGAEIMDLNGTVQLDLRLHIVDGGSGDGDPTGGRVAWTGGAAFTPTWHAFELHLDPKWNYFSVPYALDRPAVAAVFAGVPIAGGVWENVGRTCNQVDTIVPEHAYWTFLAAPMGVDVPLRGWMGADGLIPAGPGWTGFGPVAERDPPTGAQIHPLMWEWDQLRQRLESTVFGIDRLAPGKGYCVSTEGAIILDVTPPATPRGESPPGVDPPRP